MGRSSRLGVANARVGRQLFLSCLALPLIGGAGRMLDLQTRIPVTISGPYSHHSHIAIRIVG